MSTQPLKSAFFIVVNNRSLGNGPSTALPIDRDYDPAENVKVLRSTLDVITREGSLRQRLVVSGEDYRARLHSSDHQIGVQKFEGGL